MDRTIDPHEAVDFIFKNASSYAKAKAERVYLEEFRKTKKAILMKSCGESAVNALPDVAALLAERDTLARQLAEAQADARRYQYLRDQMWSQALTKVYALPILWCIDYRGEEGKSMDAAIDAATGTGG
jgi:hypothetical protein